MGDSVIRILHVDDDPSMLEVSKAILMDMEGGFEIEQACNVDGALKKLSASHFDVVVSDYEMPQKDGLQFLSELRKQKNKIPFILFTGRGREEVSIKALNLGADGYYNKQGSPETVYGELAHGIKVNYLRKKAELELEQNNQVLERAGESIDAGLAVINREYSVVWANKRLMDLGVASNKKCYETFSNLGVVCPDCGVEKIFKNNVPLDIHEYKTVNSKGETIWIELRVTPLKDKNGDTIAALILVIPITERKQAEEELRSMAKFPLENPYPVLRVAKDGIVMFANNAAKKILEKHKSGVGKLAPAMEREWTSGVLKSGLPKINEIKLEGKVISLMFVPVAEEGYVNIYGRDITQTKIAEEELLESETRFKLYIENSPTAVFIANPQGKYEYVNDAASRLVGYSKEELLEMSIPQITFEEDPTLNLNKFDEINVTGRYLSETALKTKKGAPVYVILNSVKLPDGKFMAFCENITERIQAEEQLKESQVHFQVLNEKLGVVGSLTRHDVANKLMAAKSNVYLLKKRLGDRPELAAYVDGVELALAASDRIFEFSRLYERIGVEKLCEENVFGCFNEAVALMSGLGTVKVVNECQGLVVEADSLLKQLFYNFLDNSLKHGGKVTQIRLHYSIEGDGLKLVYEDDGVGVSEANKSKLFDKGFSTGKSSGLGLYLIKKMIDVYGWTITETGEVGKGVRFVISIPKLNIKEKENYQIT